LNIQKIEDIAGACTVHRAPGRLSVGIASASACLDTVTVSFQIPATPELYDPGYSGRLKVLSININCAHRHECVYNRLHHKHNVELFIQGGSRILCWSEVGISLPLSPVLEDCKFSNGLPVVKATPLIRGGKPWLNCRKEGDQIKKPSKTGFWGGLCLPNRGRPASKLKAAAYTADGRPMAWCG
jgi:hypothetical protein